MKTHSETLAEYICGISYADLPGDVVARCKQLILDTLGVTILGSQSPWSRIILQHYQEQGGAPEAKVIFPGALLPAASAAFVNGTMAHSFDYDDDLAACHIASCVIPAAWAAAEKANASGRQLITAVAAGYDVTVRLAETLDGHHLYRMGFHPTPVCGVFGAAAAAGKILALSQDQLANAFGIAGSFSSGTLAWLGDGSMTKRLHGGMAAGQGITAAHLARRGFTGPREIFEGKNGIFQMFQARRDPGLLVRDLGVRFDVLKSFIKLYPCCTCNAPVIDAVLGLKEEHSLTPDMVDSVEVSLRETCFRLVGEPIAHKQNPGTVLDAQMSAPYAVGAALVEGEVFPEQYSPAKIQSPEISAIARKVRVTWDRDLDVDESPRPVPAVVSILLKDKRLLRRRVDYQKGSYRNPLSSPEINRKFTICTGKLSPRMQNRWIASIDRLEEVPDIGRILSSEA